MEHFDESEVREIEIDDKNYPELLRKIKNHRQLSVFVEICHRIGKLLLFSAILVLTLQISGLK